MCIKILQLHKQKDDAGLYGYDTDEGMKKKNCIHHVRCMQFERDGLFECQFVFSRCLAY